MLSNIENTKKVLFQVGGNFSLLNVVSYNFKNKDDIKLNPIYENSYASSKYSNISELTNINIRTNDYLVFSYRDKDDEGKFISEEIYISYPNLVYLRGFLNEALNDILNNTEKYFTKNNTTEEGNEVLFESPAFAQGKKLAIVPYKVERKSTTHQDSIFVDGVVIFIGDNDKFVEMDLNTFSTLVDIVNDELRLLIQSDFSFIMTQLYENNKLLNKILDILEGGNGYSSNNGNKFIHRNSSSTRRPHINPNIFRNSNSSNNDNRNQTKTNNDNNIDDIIDEEDTENVSNDSKKFARPMKNKKVKVNKNVENENKTLDELDDLMNDDSDPVISLDKISEMVDDNIDLSDLGLEDDD